MLVKELLGSILLLALIGCHSPRNVKGDHTLNKNRIKGSRGAAAYTNSGGTHPRGTANTAFLDAVESSPRASSSYAEGAGNLSTAVVDPAASKAAELPNTVQVIISESEKVLGVPYRYAGSSPARGFDCSGLTSYLFRKARIDLPRTSTDQSRFGKRKKFEQAEVGDLVFFGTGKRVTHVAVVVGRSRNSMTIVHSTSSKGVRYDEVFSSRYWNSRKLWAVDIASLTE